MFALDAFTSTTQKRREQAIAELFGNSEQLK